MRIVEEECSLCCGNGVVTAVVKRESDSFYWIPTIPKIKTETRTCLCGGRGVVLAPATGEE